MTSKEPAPVEVTNTDPMPVTFDQPTATPAQTTALVVASSAQVEADILRTADQRRISGIWERTQQVIALAVVIPTVLVSALLSLAAILSPSAPGELRALGLTAFTLLATLTGSVIGFYFGRTNHQRVGGVASNRDDIMGR